MHTLLPYKSFETTARVLDRNTLAKQPIETLQIMRTLMGDKAWAKHPVTKMWRGHADWLMKYQEVICAEWERRGNVDHYLEETQEVFFTKNKYEDLSGEHEPPPWLGLKKLHSSHRATLLRKDYLWYLKYKWPEKPQEGFWYPHG